MIVGSSSAPRVLALASCVAIAACGEESDDDVATTIADTTGATTDAPTSSGEGDSTGGRVPDACPDVALETGIVGRTDVRTCELLAECVTPTPGIALGAYTQSPQMGGNPSTPGSPIPGIEPVAELNSGVAGRYAFLLDAGTYYVCARPEADAIVCSPPVVLSADDPVVFVEYEEYLPTAWDVVSCGL
jgi:hypothetical protein